MQKEQVKTCFRLSKKRIFALMVIFIALLLLTSSFVKKLTYIETKPFFTEHDSLYELKEPDDTLTQTFEMPYEILRDVSINIATFARDNNSVWEATLTECESGKIVAQQTFHASYITDNSAHPVLEFKNNQLVNKGELYELQIKAIKVSEFSSLGFYRAPEKDGMYSQFNNTEYPTGLCLSFHGGDIDIWWIIFIGAVCMFIFVVFALLLSQKNIISGLQVNKLLQSMLIAAGVFFLLTAFVKHYLFMDEIDNMFGGSIIASGGILYKDYVVQHTPFVYYLCAIFARLGASSVEQFRLLYYAFTAVIWGGLYYRHSEYFGKKKMLVLSILSILIPAMIDQFSTMILSDNIQGICLIVIALELIRYFKDTKLGWSRCAIISVAFWCAVGSAFVSLYALFPCALVALVKEITLWKKHILKLTLGNFTKRYLPFAICLSTPVILIYIYYYANDAVDIAFEQAYRFNREVYPNYTDFGENLLQPFVDSVTHIFTLISNTLQGLVNASMTKEIFIQFSVMIISLTSLIIATVRKKFFEAAMLFSLMCFSATRGLGFHSAPSWCVQAVIIVLLCEFSFDISSKIKVTFAVVAGTLFISSYISTVAPVLLNEDTSISYPTPIDIQVIENTEENDEIFIELTQNTSLYCLYKNRIPVNRTCYMLPWYMDWYEEWAIEDLIENMPEVVVYNEHMVVWEHSYYAEIFRTELNKYYTQSEEDPSIWYLN